MDSKGARRSENIRLKSARILAAQVPLYALHVQCAKCVTGSYLDVPRGLSLAYIGTDSGTTHRDEHDFRSSRFRLGDKKEGAGAAVAVIGLGSMDIE
jgi:hypothetical protein